MTKSQIATVVAIGVMWAAKALADSSVSSNLPLNQRRPQEEAIAAAPLPYREELVTFDNPAAPEGAVFDGWTSPTAKRQPRPHRRIT